MQIKDKNTDVTFIGFNQTSSCAIVGTKKGYSLWRTNPVDLCTRGFAEHPIHICEMFFSTSLLAVVCASSDTNFSANVLYLYNTKVEQIICLLRFNEDVHAVKLNHQYLAVVLKASIIIYTLEKIEPVCTLDIYFNQSTPVPEHLTGRPSIAALCPQKPFLAYPCDPVKGNVCIAKLNEPQSQTPSSGGAPPPSGGQDNDTYGTYQIIEAHDHPVVALAFSKTGDMLATASARGTCIRVWETSTRQMIHELKRSKMGRAATIHSLCFSDDGSLLVVSSSSKTIHVFAVTGERKSETSIAQAHLDDMKIGEERHISSFGADGTFIQVIFADGNFYHFRIPPANSKNKNMELTQPHNLLHS